MSMTSEQIKSVKTTIRASIQAKFRAHKPEPAVMPFHARLLGKDRLALYAFIHSLNTNFGTTIFEPVAVALATNNFKVAARQRKAKTQISANAQTTIQRIMDDLTTGKRPDKNAEIEAIRAVCQQGKMRTVKHTKIDVYLENKSNEIYLFDIKTAKPNKGNFQEFKRTLLQWAATELAENPKAKINTLIAIPYNPYEPKPYSRWTMAGMLDLDRELKVAEEFWDFLGGKKTYDNLLDCFEQVGLEMKDEIDEYFARFNTTHSSRVEDRYRDNRPSSPPPERPRPPRGGG